MPDDVLGNEPETPVVPAGQGKDDTVTISKAELEGLRRTLSETQQSERDWAAMARRGGNREPEPRAAEPETTLDHDAYVDAGEPGLEGDTPEQLVDDIAAQGTAALAKRGFLTRGEAQRVAAEVSEKVTRELIGQERTKMGTDAQFAADFPEIAALRNNPEAQAKSELWQETAKIYQKAVSMDRAALKTPAALYLAAEAATERVKARAAAARGGGDSDDDRGELEEDRRRRADSQDGRTRTRGQATDRDDMLGPEAKQLIKAMGISDAEYKASREELSGARGRRR